MKRGWLIAAWSGTALIGAAAGFAAWVATLPPLPRLEAIRYSTEVVDREGLLLRPYATDDGRWRWHWDPALMRLWDPAKFNVIEGQRVIRERLDHARKLKVPALLVRGRMSDVVSEAGAREFLDAVPHAEYVDLASAGHMVAGDRNDAFTSSVLAFLAKHRAGRESAC